MGWVAIMEKLESVYSSLLDMPEPEQGIRSPRSMVNVA
jgi:hypothetical protein